MRSSCIAHGWNYGKRNGFILNCCVLPGTLPGALGLLGAFCTASIFGTLGVFVSISFLGQPVTVPQEAVIKLLPDHEGFLLSAWRHEDFWWLLQNPQIIFRSFLILVHIHVGFCVILHINFQVSTSLFIFFILRVQVLQGNLPKSIVLNCG